MTREEFEKKREEALKNRFKSKFTAAPGEFILVKPSETEGKADKKH